MEITKKQRQDIAEIANKYGLILVLLFGSHVRGTTHRESDVDIGFLSNQTMSLLEIARIQFELSQKLKIPMIELIPLGGKPAIFLHQVASEGMVLYESAPGVFTSFISYALKRFDEERPLRALRHESLRTFSTTV